MKKSVWLLMAILSLTLVSAAWGQNAAPAGTVKGATAVAEGVVEMSFNFVRPNQVQRYAVFIPDATALGVQVEDLFMAGDHWQATVKINDKFPMEVATVATGSPGVYSPVARVYSFGAKPLYALVEVRYLHGVDVFAAGGGIKFIGNTATLPTVTDLGIFDF